MNIKYVNALGEEYIFNIKTKKRVKDGINDGTFNVAGEDDKWYKKNLIDVILHFKYDVKEGWIENGIGIGDKLKQEKRQILNDMGELYVLNPLFKKFVESKNNKLTESVYKEYMKLNRGKYEEF